MEDHRVACCHLPGNNSGGITEEQYHSHQQQLIQMQKQQLEQLQLQNNNALYRHTSLCGARSTRSSESRSKTVDSASAQFAASAVISATLPPLLVPRGHNSENKPYKSSINGVLHSSGPSRPPYSSSSSVSRLGLSARGSLSSSTQSLPNQRNQVRAPLHTARPSAPPTSALKLTTITASLDRVPKVSTAR
ncbi:enhancer of polycomb homolog 2-like [Anarrhichthys ocellatus]|uniref:enhancer of polycomb homolog 2-like n=1 Tax=Anarrhichthys ocellatus TaxID=433405 RepID=UPI0012EE98EB|nr:enhancer of polycomb homolog 2-like [Anarrhichthys ocellatus]XP_031696199.1 enhancer of polycomb homolog 2-like [Anarrhichthys ocellatus]